MSVIHQCLGAIAAVNDATSRIRVRFIPLNIVLMIGLGAGGWWGLSLLQSRFEDGRNPQPTDHTALYSRDSDFVTMQGFLFPEAEFLIEEYNSYGEVQRVSDRWIPLIDEGTGRAILVDPEQPTDVTEAPFFSAVSGMIEAIDPDLRSDLNTSDLGEGFRLETIWVLREGKQPTNILSGVIISSSFGLVLMAFLTVVVKRNTIFASVGKPMRYSAIPAPDRSIGMRISANLSLTPQQSKHFLNAPGAIMWTEAGQLVLYTNTLSSSQYTGEGLDANIGCWKSIIDAKSLEKVDSGHQYFGNHSRPALRFTYSETNGRRSKAVLSFSNSAERQYTYNLIKHPHSLA